MYLSPLVSFSKFHFTPVRLIYSFVSLPTGITGMRCPGRVRATVMGVLQILLGCGVPTVQDLD